MIYLFPVFYILMDHKSYDDYFNALGYAIQATDFKIEALTGTCDFEKGFLKAILEQFGTDQEVFNMICCLFHFKQANRRKLLALHVDNEVVAEFMAKHGLFELLTVIPIDEIVSKGIPYIKAHFDTKGHDEEFAEFWIYFESTWTVTYDPTIWNINRFIVGKKSSEIVNRTNNPLECFNNHFQHRLTAHPSMIEFVKAIRDISNEYVQRLTNIRKGRDVAPKRKVVDVMSIPKDY